jgi:hypothetical protein
MFKSFFIILLTTRAFAVVSCPLYTIGLSKIEETAKQNGFKPLEIEDKLTVPFAELKGHPVIAVEVVEVAGKPPRIRVVKGFIERVPAHFIIAAIDPRRPRYDGVVVIDEAGKRTLLKSGGTRDRIFLDPTKKVEVKAPPSELGWTPVTPLTRELVGKEIKGYQEIWQGVGQSRRLTHFPVNGIIRAITSYEKWRGSWGFSNQDSPVTGPPPYIAVEIVSPEGTVFEHPLSAPGAYSIRNLNP